MAGRRAFLAAMAGLIAMAAGPDAMAQKFRPPDNFLRLDNITLPLPGDRYRVVVLKVDLVLRPPLQKETARQYVPRIVSRLLAESTRDPVAPDGRLDTQAAKRLKQRVLAAARAYLGDAVEDVMIVSLLTT